MNEPESAVPVSTGPKHDPDPVPTWLQWVVPKLNALRFGSVHLVVHDGRVTQVDVTERSRLN